MAAGIAQVEADVQPTLPVLPEPQPEAGKSSRKQPDHLPRNNAVLDPVHSACPDCEGAPEEIHLSPPDLFTIAVIIFREIP